MGQNTFPIVIDLQKPVTLGEALITRLELQEPTAGDYRKVRDPGRMLDAALDLAAEMSSVPAAALDKLGAADFQQLVSKVNPFFCSGSADRGARELGRSLWRSGDRRRDRAQRGQPHAAGRVPDVSPAGDEAEGWACSP